MATRSDPLAPYHAKRDFARTPEPRGKAAKPAATLQFIVHRHAATRLHYDLRLEWGGVLKSWAVTRGPSLDPGDKRLAVEVEDHPLDYGSFEGTIPKPGYGAGTVQIWDRGAWAPLHPDAVDADLARGEIKFVLSGERLKGGFVLVRLKPRAGEPPERHNWLLIKERDSMATPGEGDAVLKAETSVASGRTMAEIEGGKPEGRAARAKPKPPEAMPANAKPAVEKAAAPKARKAAPAAKADPAAMPDFVPPQLCRLVASPPRGETWLHELKLDGYRVQLRVAGGRAALRTRTGLDWTHRFANLAKTAAALPNCLLDGEVVALDDQGQPSFSLLQAMLSGDTKPDYVFYLFDLLHDGTRDYRGDPLLDRKARLAELLRGAPKSLRYLDHFTAPGEAVLASACRLSMEGIVSKRGDAPYASGRNDSWTKAKCRGREEFIVGGWSRDKAGKGLGALLVGARRAEGLAYLGRVGTGYSGRTAEMLLARMKPLQRKATPFAGRQPERTSDVTWVEPELVVEIAYGGWTDAGILRHASFIGLREDKPAEEVVADDQPLREDPPAEKPAAAPKAPRPAKTGPTGARLTHPERIIWPETEGHRALTKGDLAAYFERCADRILDHIAGRPLSILRAPDGIGGEVFFQRHAMRGQSPLIGAVEVAGQARPYMRIDDVAGLMALAQVSAVELHPWGARADRPDVPERLVFDLDPAEGLGFAAVAAGALELRDRLKALGLTSFARVTGGKGLHVVVPLDTGGKVPDWAATKQFARLVCGMMEKDAPGRYTTTMAKSARTGRIFLDYLRNDRLSTAIASWSPRARAGAPIARPIAWSAVKPTLDPAGWRIDALIGKPAAADPWTGFEAAATPLRAAIETATRPAKPAKR
ncbi:DNA ligase D [Plastoroseomonas arctica]|uniref:DNA ligase (ATP) n=1 Tax=Plastoroseomonas arctica TaxID=1509237 RepID=A0AAF1K6W2_9PROT|nr:DNA ligase D [Plastoroseomonas arctica]MBR0656826.1 DNA ligase D [Plastoroseomonas arctica]